MMRIRQATKQGWIECVDGGAADLAYPTSKTRRGRVQEDGRVIPTLTTESEIYRMSENVYRIRKLTPRECWRLMDFGVRNDDGTWNDECFEKAETVCSNTQLYKQAGNSIVVSCIRGIAENLFRDGIPEARHEQICPVCGTKLGNHSWERCPICGSKV